MKPFEIFRTGTHTSSNGFTKEYSLEDLEQIADNYNRSEHEAPIVIGHPKSNAPAYGWIEKIFVEGDRLFAKAKDLAADFVQAVKDKKFKKRSISLTPDNLLNHVGFLGATVPAVKGLADVEFNEDDDLTEFEFDKEILEEEFSHSDSSEEQDQEATEQNQEQNEEQDEEPQNHSSVEDLDDRKNHDLKKYFENLSDNLNTVISEFKSVVEKQSQTNKNFMEENSDELEKLENRMSDLRAKIDVSNFELMLNQKVAYGNLTPAMKNKIVDIIEYFETLNFEETNSRKLSSDLQTMLTEFVDSIPKLVEFEEVAEKNQGYEEVQDDSFDDYDLDPESAKLHEDIVKTMKSDELSYEEAFHKVINEK